VIITNVKFKNHGELAVYNFLKLHKGKYYPGSDFYYEAVRAQ
jgi:hypothetical protein